MHVQGIAAVCTCACVCVWQRMYEPLTMRRSRRANMDGGARGKLHRTGGISDEDDDASDGDLEALRRDVAAGVERPQRKRRQASHNLCMINATGTHVSVP